jgi:hypothetical protein
MERLQHFLDQSINAIRSEQNKQVLPVGIAKRHWSDAMISYVATRACVGLMAMTERLPAIAGPISTEPIVRTNITSAFCRGPNV